MKGKHESNISVDTGLTRSGSSSSIGFDKYAKDAIPLDFEVPMLGPDHVNEIAKANGFDRGEA
jgi:predicted TPR repeat methyltransferase